MSSEKTHNLTPIRDLGLPAEFTKRIQTLRETAEEVELHSRQAVIKATHLGFQLIVTRKDLGIQHGGTRKKGERLSPWSWTELVPLLIGATYRSGKNYIDFAQRVAAAFPEAAVLLKTDFADLPKSKQEKMHHIFLQLPNHPELCRIGTTANLPEPEITPGTNNPNGKNGHDSPPLSPDQKREQLEFEALSGWFGSKEPTKTKPGSTCHRLLTEAGVLPGPDGKPAIPTWTNLPKDSLQILQPALAKLAAEMAKTLKS